MTTQAVLEFEDGGCAVRIERRGAELVLKEASRPPVSVTGDVPIVVPVGRPAEKWALAGTATPGVDVIVSGGRQEQRAATAEGVWLAVIDREGGPWISLEWRTRDGAVLRRFSLGNSGASTGAWTPYAPLDTDSSGLLA